MNNTTPAPRWRRWLVALLIIAVFIELLWLVGVNSFLALDSTQRRLSDIRPDRVKMTWERARSWYPGHAKVTGAKVSGQTPRFQWQADVEQVEGNVALLPLLQRKVVIRNVYIPDGDYRQRSRLKTDGSNQEVSQWFPPIRNYELTPVGEPPKPKRKPWTIVFENAELSGSYTTWVHRFQADLDLTARVNVEVRTQGGPLDLRVADLDADVSRLWADKDQTIFDDGTVTGTMSLGPYRYREQRGGRALRFLGCDLELDFNSQDMGFVRLFLLKFQSLNVTGKGKANGRLRIEEGRIAEGTDLNIDADDLVVSQPPFKVLGQGAVSLKSSSDQDKPFLVGMQYDNLEIYLWEDDSPLITGNALMIDIYDDGDIVPRKLQESPPPFDFIANIVVPHAGIDDVTKFNRFLPMDSPMLFTGGATDFTAKLTFTPINIEGHYSLGGEQLTALIDQQLVGLDMRFDGVVSGDEPLKGQFRLDGSVLELSNAQVVGEESSMDEENWSANAHITEGSLSLLHTPDLSITTDLQVSDSRPVSALFINNGGPKWIGRRLDVANLKGDARIRFNNRDVYIPEAKLGAEDLEFAIKGVVAQPDIHGMAYFRYKRLDAGLKFENGKRDFVLIGPIKKFEEYSIAVPPTR